MNKNAQNWDREYQKPIFLTKGEKPRKDVVNFMRFLRKNAYLRDDMSFLDLGTGTGRNAFFAGTYGLTGIGIDSSKTAINLAKDRLKKEPANIDFKIGSIGEKLDTLDESVDIVFDVLSSNSLNEKEREVYLSEMKRVLKPCGYILVKALCKDGDKNAKTLLKDFPGTETDTYVLPDVGIIERVFSIDDFKKLYGQYFKIEKLDKKSNYMKSNGRLYKRNYIVAVLSNNLDSLVIEEILQATKEPTLGGNLRELAKKVK